MVPSFSSSSFHHHMPGLIKVDCSNKVHFTVRWKVNDPGQMYVLVKHSWSSQPPHKQGLRKYSKLYMCSRSPHSVQLDIYACAITLACTHFPAQEMLTTGMWNNITMDPWWLYPHHP